jgi:hypothetical protein
MGFFQIAEQRFQAAPKLRVVNGNRFRELIEFIEP